MVVSLMELGHRRAARPDFFLLTGWIDGCGHMRSHHSQTHESGWYEGGLVTLRLGAPEVRKSSKFSREENPCMGPSSLVLFCLQVASWRGEGHICWFATGGERYCVRTLEPVCTWVCITLVTVLYLPHTVRLVWRGPRKTGKRMAF